MGGVEAVNALRRRRDEPCESGQGRRAYTHHPAAVDSPRDRRAAQTREDGRSVAVSTGARALPHLPDALLHIAHDAICSRTRPGLARLRCSSSFMLRLVTGSTPPRLDRAKVSRGPYASHRLFATVSRVHGYAERFDFDNQTVSGWVFDADAENNRDVRVVASFDGDLVGEASPNGSRDDLLKITSQDTTFLLQCSRSFTAVDVLSGRFVVKACCGDREAVMRFTTNGVTALNRAAVNVLPVGTQSPDGSAVVGLRGHLFLTGGSNSLLSQYQAPVDGTLISQVDRWVDLFAQRREQCEVRGISYLQTVLPEKLTVLRADAPLQIDGPSPLFRELESRLRGKHFYVSGLKPFELWSSEDDPYLTTDTHLSATGAQRVFANLAARIDPQLVPVIHAIRMDEIRYAAGDLTERFGLPILSRIVEPSEAQVSAYGEGLTMVEKHFPPTNGSIGRRFRWVNDTAPSAHKVLVFGNSFFSIGDFAGQLSWWGKHLFREFHFHWGPDVDWDLVDELRPDIVLGQTVERFLGRVPEA